ncbi:hypothetical protein JHK87_039492 [Glycine soja]|nr:hypothetical protein JHK87_039492 [Glycine soja]
MSLYEFCFNAENGSNRERMRKKNYECETQVFKSKNLEVERRRREKLSTRLLMMRYFLQGEVQATKIDGNKLWVKMIIEKKKGRFKKLMVTTLTSTVDGDEAPSMVDGGAALRGSLLNAPRQPPNHDNNGNNLLNKEEEEIL